MWFHGSFLGPFNYPKIYPHTKLFYVLFSFRYKNKYYSFVYPYYLLQTLIIKSYLLNEQMVNLFSQ